MFADARLPVAADFVGETGNEVGVGPAAATGADGGRCRFRRWAACAFEVTARSSPSPSSVLSGGRVAQFGALLPVGATGEEDLSDLGGALAGMVGGRGAGCAWDEPVLGLLAVRAGGVVVEEAAVFARAVLTAPVTDEELGDLLRCPAAPVVLVAFVDGVGPAGVPPAFDPVEELGRSPVGELGEQDVGQGGWQPVAESLEERLGEALHDEADRVSSGASSPFLAGAGAVLGHGVATSLADSAAGRAQAVVEALEVSCRGAAAVLTAGGAQAAQAFFAYPFGPGALLAAAAEMDLAEIAMGAVVAAEVVEHLRVVSPYVWAMSTKRE
ncbi:hypothetical protein ACIQUY_34915 [Streptomyces sp. NPDC090231]|uniref:hypothetical protein n=1 Tax=unclassified Streptomyces TaxID=2593676 RepID=UPI002E15C69A